MILNARWPHACSVARRRWNTRLQQALTTHTISKSSPLPNSQKEAIDTCVYPPLLMSKREGGQHMRHSCCHLHDKHSFGSEWRATMLTVLLHVQWTFCAWERRDSLCLTVLEEDLLRCLAHPVQRSMCVILIRKSLPNHTPKCHRFSVMISQNNAYTQGDAYMQDRNSGWTEDKVLRETMHANALTTTKRPHRLAIAVTAGLDSTCGLPVSVQKDWYRTPFCSRRGKRVQWCMFQTWPGANELLLNASHTHTHMHKCIYVCVYMCARM